MRRLTTALIIATTLLLGAILTSAHNSDFELEKRHVKNIAVRNVSPRNGKNVALEIAVNPPPGVKLPRGITALVNTRQVQLYDNGAWPDDRGGDGVYTAGAATKSGEPLKENTTFRLPGGELFEHAVAPKISCKFKVKECPKDCTSILFHSKCVICFELEECEISFLD
jgi:hypothetical protein